MATSSKAAPRWRRMDSRDRRAEILRAARKLFHKKMFSAVSTEEIAKAAGVTRGLVHHYFGTKRKLFLAVARDAIARAPRLDIPELRPDAPLEEVVATGVDLWLDAIASDPEMFLTVMGSEGLARDAALERSVAATKDATVAAMIGALGLDDSEAVRAQLRAYSGLVEAATREWVERKTLDRADVGSLLTTALIAIVTEIRRCASSERH